MDYIINIQILQSDIKKNTEFKTFEGDELTSAGRKAIDFIEEQIKDEVLF